MIDTLKRKLYITLQMLNKLKELRVQANFNQTEFAKLCGVSRQTIHAIEAGNLKPTVMLSLKISTVLKTKIEKIFSLEPEDWE